MEDAELTGQYLRTLSGQSDPFFRERSEKSDAPVCAADCKQALDRAHELRRFEIDLSWKRAQYFWAFQATSFVSIGISSEKALNIGVVIAASIVGAITAWVGYLSAKGSKFWQENWELHVDMLENVGGDGRLTKIILGKSVDAYSVSRLNRSLLLFLTSGWLLTLSGALIYACFGNVFDSYVQLKAPCMKVLFLFGCFVLIATIMFIMQDCNRTELPGTFLVGQDWRTARQKKRELWMLLREINH